MKYSIIVKDLVKSYGELLALDGFSMRCRERKIYALLGPNGSGKTTFIKCLFGLLPFTSGELSILGRSVPHELPHVYKKLGYMPQEYSLYEDLTVRENLEFFGNLYGFEGDELDERILKVSDLVQLEEKMDSLFRELSGGLKRRLSLATTLLHNPKVIIADEPTVGIDPILRVSFWRHFRELNKRGVTFLITTHIMDEVMKADFVGFIAKGKLIAEGPPKRLMEEYDAKDIEGVFLKKLEAGSYG